MSSRKAEVDIEFEDDSKEEKEEPDDNYTEVRIKELDINTINPISVDDPKGGSKIVVIGKPGCFEKETSMLMYDGSSKNVEDIKVGDVLMGDDSTPRNVLELCRGMDRMYNIKSLDKNIKDYVVNSKHILSLLKSSSDPYKTNLEKVDINLQDFLKKDTEERSKYFGYKNVVEFKDNKDLSIEDMYKIGKDIILYRNINKCLISSKEQRLYLLKGIIESCGYLRGYNMTIVSLVHARTLQIIRLIESLGIQYNTSYYKKMLFITFDYDEYNAKIDAMGNDAGHLKEVARRCARLI